MIPNAEMMAYQVFETVLHPIYVLVDCYGLKIKKEGNDLD